MGTGSCTGRGEANALPRGRDRTGSVQRGGGGGFPVDRMTDT